MKTTDLNKVIDANTLNESMFKKFGVKINFENYSREQLENYRNLLRTKISQHESGSNFNELLANEAYQKDKYIMGVLNQRIKEMLGESRLAERKLTGAEKKKREEIVKAIKRDNPEKRTGKGKSSAYAIATAQAKKTAEGTDMKATEATKKKAKPDFLDMDKDGNKKEPMKKAVKDKKATEGWDDMMKSVKSKSGPQPNGGAGVKKGKAYGGAAQKDEKEPEVKKSKKVKEALKGNQDKLDMDHDGKLEKSDFKKLRASKKKSVKESVEIMNRAILQFLREDEEGKAKSITAAGDMVNDFTTWMTRIGQYQTKSMIELADNIRANFGQAAADQFKTTVAPALEEALSSLQQSRETISHAVAVLAGEETSFEPMGQQPGMDEFGGAEELPASEPDAMNASDEFGAADAAAGGPESAGREMRESRAQLFARRLSESHSILRKLSK